MKPLRYKSLVISPMVQADVVISMTGQDKASSRSLARFCLADKGLERQECDRVISRIMQAARRRGEVIAKGHRWYRIVRSDTND